MIKMSKNIKDEYNNGKIQDVGKNLAKELEGCS